VVELETALKSIKPQDRIVEKEKVVYQEDEERIRDFEDRINDLE